MDTDRVLEIARIICRMSDDGRRRATDTLGSVRSVDWRGQSRDAFLGEMERVAAAIHEQMEEVDRISQRLQREAREWEEVGRHGIARFAHVSIATPAISAGLPLGTGGPPTQKGAFELKAGQGLVGDPAGLAGYVQKQSGNTCALYAQGTALRALGYDVDVNRLKELGPKVGYVDIFGWDNGVGLGKVWNHFGVPYESFHRNGLVGTGIHSGEDHAAAVQFLGDALLQRKALVVGVEFDRLYDGIRGVQDNGWPFQGHAVWVTGLVTDAAGKVTEVALNDSAWGETTRVPIDNFMRAWESRNYQAIATHNSFPIVGVDAISDPVA